MPSNCLGIDPGLASTGYGVVTLDGNHVAHGVIKTLPTEQMPHRLAEISTDISKLLEQFHPTLVVVEDFMISPGRMNTNITKMPMTIGAILAAIGRYNNQMQVVMYPSRSMKKDMVGDGNADKNDIQMAVQMALKLDKLPKPNHAADALALALCGISRVGIF